MAKRNPTKKTHAKHARNWIDHARKALAKAKTRSELWLTLEWAHYAQADAMEAEDEAGEQLYAEAGDLAREIQQRIEDGGPKGNPRNPQTRTEKKRRRERLDAKSILRKAMRGT